MKNVLLLPGLLLFLMQAVGEAAERSHFLQNLPPGHRTQWSVFQLGRRSPSCSRLGSPAPGMLSSGTITRPQDRRTLQSCSMSQALTDVPPWPWRAVGAAFQVWGTNVASSWPYTRCWRFAAHTTANCHARNTDFPALPSIFLVLSKSIPVLKFRQDHRNFPQLFGTFSWFLGISLFILGIAESLAGITGWNPTYFLNILECFLAISVYYHTPF